MASVLRSPDARPVPAAILAPRGSQDRGDRGDGRREETQELTEGLESLRRVARVLVVDDDDGVRRQLCYLLEDEGYEVEAAATGAAALTVATESRFDVVILDVRLPDVSGIEVFEAFRRRSENVKTIIVSGFLVDEEIAKAEHHGAHFLAKPVDSGRLLALLALLERRGEAP